MRAARRMNIAALSGFHTNYHSYSRHYRLGCLQALVFRYLRHLHNGTAETLVPSIELRDRLQGLGFKNVNLLGRGVDSDLFRPQRRCEELRRCWGLRDRDVAMLYVGRIAPEKNLGLALKAYRAIRGMNSSVKFILVGDGPLKTALQKEHPDLIFCGTQTGEQLARHYASGDIFVFPSETETFGNVTLEAMASGLGVVAYDYAAAKSHIAHGETGLLVPYGDSRSFYRFGYPARSPIGPASKAENPGATICNFDQLVICRRKVRIPAGRRTRNSRDRRGFFRAPEVGDRRNKEDVERAIRRDITRIESVPGLAR